MNELLSVDFELLERCPWDGAPVEKSVFLYQDDMGSTVGSFMRNGG